MTTVHEIDYAMILVDLRYELAKVLERKAALHLVIESFEALQRTPPVETTDSGQLQEQP